MIAAQTFVDCITNLQNDQTSWIKMEFSDSFSTQVISSNYSNFILSLGIVQILGALVDIPILVSLLILSTYSRRTVTNLRIYESKKITESISVSLGEFVNGILI